MVTRTTFIDGDKRLTTETPDFNNGHWIGDPIRLLVPEDERIESTPRDGYYYVRKKSQIPPEPVMFGGLFGRGERVFTDEFDMEYETEYSFELGVLEPSFR